MTPSNYLQNFFQNPGYSQRNKGYSQNFSPEQVYLQNMMAQYPAVIFNLSLDYFKQARDSSIPYHAKMKLLEIGRSLQQTALEMSKPRPEKLTQDPYGRDFTPHFNQFSNSLESWVKDEDRMAEAMRIDPVLAYKMVGNTAAIEKMKAYDEAKAYWENEWNRFKQTPISTFSDGSKYYPTPPPVDPKGYLL